MTVTECQHCHVNPVEKPWTLCPACRRDYARALHSLRRNMLLLQAVARRAYRLGDHTAGRAQGGAAPAPINVHAQDVLDETETLLQDAWADTGAAWSDRWQRLIPRMQSHLAELCQAAHAGEYLHRLEHANQRIMPLVDRRPRTRRIVGVCPECGREVTAAKSESLRACRCGALVDVDRLREETAEAIGRYHRTLTPAGCSRWLRDDYGLDVSRKTITDWLRRGKLPSSKPVSGGYWEFDIRETVTMAMGRS